MKYPKPTFKPRYENYIDGQWTAPVDGQYFQNSSTVDGADFCDIPRSNETIISGHRSMESG